MHVVIGLFFPTSVFTYLPFFSIQKNWTSSYKLCETEGQGYISCHGFSKSSYFYFVNERMEWFPGTPRARTRTPTIRELLHGSDSKAWRRGSTPACPMKSSYICIMPLATWGFWMQSTAVAGSSREHGRIRWNSRHVGGQCFERDSPPRHPGCSLNMQNSELS